MKIIKTLFNPTEGLKEYQYSEKAQAHLECSNTWAKISLVLSVIAIFILLFVTIIPSFSS